jgi:hypothetical protein
LASAYASMFWGELRVVSSRGASPAPALIGQKAKPSTVDRACEATEEIAAAAIYHQPRRFMPAGFSMVFAALRGGPVGFDGAGFVPTSLDAFDAVGAANRDAHRCSRRLWM